MWVLDDKIVLARKQHRCYACSGVIEPGTPYLRTKVADSGDINTFKEHVGCFEILLACGGGFTDWVANGWPQDAMWELINQTFDQRRKEYLEALQGHVTDESERVRLLGLFNVVNPKEG